MHYLLGLLFASQLAIPPELGEVQLENNTISAFSIDPQAQVSDATFIADYGYLWGLGATDAMISNGTKTVANGFIVRSYRRQHSGYAVLDQSLLIVSKNGFVKSGVARLRPITSMAINRSQGQSEKIAVDNIELVLSLPKKPKLEHSNMSQAIVNGRLSWLLYTHEKDLGSFHWVAVDASNGNIVFHTSGVADFAPASVPGIDVRNEGVIVSAELDDDPAQTVRLRSPPLNFNTFHTGADFTYPLTDSDITSTGGSFGPPQRTAVTAHYGMEASANYLFQRFSIDGVDGNGLMPTIYLLDAAASSSETPFYVYAEPTPLQEIANDIFIPKPAEPAQGIVSVDAIAHEFGHALYVFTAHGMPVPNPADGTSGCSSEACGLTEGLSDVFGVLADYHLTGVLEWRIGDTAPGFIPRHLDDPSLSEPEGASIYDDPFWQAMPNNPHVKGGVIGLWFYRLVTGAQGLTPNGIEWDVEALGVEQSEEIAIRTLTERVTTTMTFDQFRAMTLSKAQELCGLHSHLEVSATNAWFSVGVGQPYTDTVAIMPPDGATDVEPWPTLIAFEVQDGETEWTVEIDTDTTFQSENMRPLTNFVDHQLSGRPAKLVSANLRPATTYYWRIRVNPAGSDTPFPCYRPTHSFTTNAQLAHLLSPLPDEPPAEKDPWELPFGWRKVPGGLSHRMEVIDPVRNYEHHRDVELSDCAVNACRVDLNLAVESEFSWHVKAFGPTDLYDPNESEYSESGMMTTALPSTTITDPDEGEGTYPWNFEVHWTEVAGAPEYRLDVTDELTGIEEAPITVPGNIEAEASVTPHFDVDNALITVSLTPIGPLVEPTVGASFTDEGDTASVSLVNEGTATIPCMRAPWNLCDSADPNIPFSEVPPEIYAGNAVGIQWDTVDDAAGYVIETYPFTKPPLPFAADFGALRYNEEVAAPATSLTIPRSAATPEYGIGEYGHWVSIRARGPNGSLSPIARLGPTPPILDPDYIYQRGEAPYLTRIPDITFDDSNLDIRNGELYFDNPYERSVDLRFVMDTVWSPIPIRLELYYGSDCEVLIEVGTLHDSSFAITSIIFPVEGFSFDTDYSVAAVARSDYDQIPSEFSGCYSFRTASETEQLCGNGNTDDNEECDDGRNDDGDGCDASCNREIECGTSIGDAGGSGGYDQPVGIGVNSAGFEEAYLVFNTFRIPDNIIVYYEGTEIARTGCIGSTQPVAIALNAFSGSSTEVRVVVEPNCEEGNTGNTEWAFLITCPNNQGADPGGTPE